MKKIGAILLLSAHLFYIGGFNLLFLYCMHRSDVEIVKQIYDNKIDAAKLFEIKVPVNLPYITDWKDYEQIEGQIQLNGTYYNYVRLKICRDTMSLICIPNTVKTNLAKANVIMAKEMNDVPLGKKAPNSSQVKKAAFENVFANFKERYSYTRFGNTIAVKYYSTSNLITHPFIEAPGKPPNSVV